MSARRRRGLWLAAGVLAFVVLRRKGGPSSAELEQWGDGWVFPVPDLELESALGSPLGTYRATDTQEFKPSHRGLDIMYVRRRPEDKELFPPGKPDAFGAKQAEKFFAPEDTPIVAAKDGKVFSLAQTPHGIAVVIDHGKPWATFYGHLRSVVVARGDSVKAGQRIGTMGHSPLDGERLRHLHFETWFTGAGKPEPQDPRPVLDRFARQTWRT